MTIAEFFVNIGVKGADVTVRVLSGAKKAMGELGQTSIETKVAILAALYGLEKFTGAAGQRGMELDKFAKFTGLSAQSLQKWQYAMHMSGVEAGDTQQSIQGLQSAMLKMSIGQGAPAGMQRLSEVLKGGLDKSKWTDAFYMMDKLREYSKTEGNAALRNETMASFGLSPAMIQAMATSKIDPNKVSSSKILGSNDVGRLSEVNKSWLELHHTLEHMGDQFISKHGLEMVKGVERIAISVLKLVESLTQLAEKLKIFQILGSIIEGVSDFVGVLSGDPKSMKDNADLLEKRKQEQKNREKSGSSYVGDKIRSLFHSNDAMKNSVTPNLNAPHGSKGGTVNNVKVENHNHGVKDMHEGSHHVKKAVQGAFYQLQSQNMVT